MTQKRMSDHAAQPLGTDPRPRHDAELDCLGLRCPLPVLKARKALLLMQPGAVLRIASNDPVAVLDIPTMARDEGHSVVHRHVDGATATFWIKRSAPSLPPDGSAVSTP